MQSAGTAVCPVGGLQAGSYVFLLTVTDNLGNTDTASVTVTVMSNERLNTTDQALLYPNPTQNASTLHIQSSLNGTVLVSVYNLRGAVVTTMVTEKQAPSIDMQLNSGSLARGMYVLVIQIDGQRWNQLQWIKQ